MLKPKQEQAISLLIQGQSITDISKDLDVARSTIYEWLNNDFEFIAELNKERNAIIDNSRDNMQRLLFKSYKLLDKKLDLELIKDDPDVTVAINLIKALPKEYTKNHDTSIEAVKNTASMDQYFNSFNV